MSRLILGVGVTLAAVLLAAQVSDAQSTGEIGDGPMAPASAPPPSEPASPNWTEGDSASLFDGDPLEVAALESKSLEVAPERTLISLVSLGAVETVEIDGGSGGSACKAFDGRVALRQLDAAFQREGLSRQFASSTREIFIVHSTPTPPDSSPATYYDLRIKPVGCVRTRCKYEITANYVEVPREENGRLLLSQRQLRSTKVTNRLYGTLEGILRDTCARPSLLSPVNAAIAVVF